MNSWKGGSGLITRIHEYLHLNHDNGLTLIELLIVMSMTGFILAIGFSMYFLEAKTYTSGMNRSDAQFECRKAVQFITSQVRTAGAGKVDINNNNDFNNSSIYIYVDTNTHLLMFKNKGSEAVIKAGIINEVKFSNIEFTCPKDGILGINITVSWGSNETYNLNTEVKLLNDPSDTKFTQNASKYSRIQINP